MRQLIASLAMGAALFAVGTAAAAQNLVIGTSAPATSIDPHFYDHDPSNAVNRHIYETLVSVTPDHGLAPGLAESWTALDPTTWEFKLRRGVTFHDGSPFTAHDVQFSLTRARDIPNSPGSFAYLVRPISEIAVVDDHTVRFKTAQVFPVLPNYMSAVFMIGRKHGEGAATADYNSGKAAIGTGPYRLERYSPQGEVVFRAHGSHWAGKPAWENATVKVLSNPASRVAALLAQDVDVIESIPTTDMARLRGDKRVRVWEGLSARTMFLVLDFRAETPMIRARNGSPIPNPLTDPRVRQALGLAINRPAMVERVMEGQAIATGQIVPRDVHGYDGSIAVPSFDLEAARKLLAEAGFPSGFKVTLHGPSDRYPNDRQQLEAVAQMWARLGLDATVETLPSAVYFTRASKQEFSVFLIGYGAGTTGGISVYRANLMTFDSAKGDGSNNRGRYSNAAFDAIMTKALGTIDVAARHALLQQAGRLAATDAPVIPLFYLTSSWATRDSLAFTTRVDGFTTAMGVARAN